MSTLTKTLLAVAATMLVAGAAYAATTPAGQNAAPAPAATDVKGPCDEPEHATDPRCAGPQVPEDRPNEAEHADRHRGHDDGVAHEAENENEPNDVGDDNPGEAERHDNRGPGSLNSGPGNAEDRGDDAVMEDNSGPGSDDSGHSGSGHDGSDDSGSDDPGSGGSGHD
jgi:hypothetical protein